MRTRTARWGLSAAFVAAGLTLTACNDGSATATATPASSSQAPNATSSKPGSSATPPTAGTDATPPAADDGSSGSGDKNGVGQVCGANDLSWSTKSETQAGGYLLVMAKAKPGISCVLPAALPTMSFGSNGIEAGPAEQSVGEAVTLSGSTTAYAGVNPKTTNGDDGVEFDTIIVGVGNADPGVLSLPVGNITVDKPIVTNWHTSAADAVPFSGTDQ